MAKDLFETVFQHRDDVMDLTNDVRVSAENPYDIFWELFNNRDLRAALCGRRRIKVTHLPTGTAIVATVDFDGADEHGFSSPLAVNEKALDAWIEKCGVSLELPAS